MAERKSKKIGSLWLKEKQRPDGSKMRYFTGTLDLGVLGEIQIAVFKVDKKSSEKAPDYNIVLSQPKQNNTQRQSGDEYEDDIPF